MRANWESILSEEPYLANYFGEFTNLTKAKLDMEALTERTVTTTDKTPGLDDTVLRLTFYFLDSDGQLIHESTAENSGSRKPIQSGNTFHKYGEMLAMTISKMRELGIADPVYRILQVTEGQRRKNPIPAGAYSVERICEIKVLAIPDRWFEECFDRALTFADEMARYRGWLEPVVMDID